PLWTWLCFAAAVPAIALFVWWEFRRVRLGRDVLFDLRLFRDRGLAVGTAIGLTYFAGFIGLLFALSLHLQLGLDHSQRKNRAAATVNTTASPASTASPDGCGHAPCMLSCMAP